MIKSKKLSKFKIIKHAFFNKIGGKSTGIFKSLNCGPGSSDKKVNIYKNLKIVQKKIKAENNKIILLNQIHSNKFHFIDKDVKTQSSKFIGDALITNKRKTPIAILTADCAPVLIFDKRINMIAAVHVGWKLSLIHI